MRISRSRRGGPSSLLQILRITYVSVFLTTAISAQWIRHTSWEGICMTTSRSLHGPGNRSTQRLASAFKPTESQTRGLINGMLFQDITQFASLSCSILKHSLQASVTLCKVARDRNLLSPDTPWMSVGWRLAYDVLGSDVLTIFTFTSLWNSPYGLIRIEGRNSARCAAVMS